MTDSSQAVSTAGRLGLAEAREGGGASAGSSPPGGPVAGMAISVPGEGLEALGSQLPAAVWAVDADLRFTFATGGGLRSLGFRAGDLAGTSLREQLGSGGSGSGHKAAIRAHLEALTGCHGSFELERGGRLFLGQVAPLRSAGNLTGPILGCVCTVLDLSGARQSAQVQARARAHSEATLAAVPVGLIRTDREGRVDFLNLTAAALTGWRPELALGLPLEEVFRLVDEATGQPLPSPVRRCLAEGVVAASPEDAQLRPAEGKQAWVRGSAAPIFDAAGVVCGAVLVFEDITELRGLEREMTYLASHDALTGLLNRRELESRLLQAIHSAAAGGEQRRHALLYLDLDEFKVVNDTCGHLVGDDMLRQVTALLRARMGGRDVLARLGGDEFGVLLEDCPVSRARALAEEIRRSLKDFRFAWRDRIFGVGVSIGLVPIDAKSGDLAQVMSAADAACYIAKDRGRNRVHEYEPDDTAVTARYGEMHWVHRIHSAFEDRRFRLFYQLIQPLAAGQGREEGQELLCEVLLRMLGQDGELIEPAAFVTAAERYHLVTALDRWVIETAFGALAEAQRNTMVRPVLFAIKVSGRSIADESFLPFILTAFAHSRVDPRRVCFEISETAAVAKLDSTQRFLTTLKEKGCRFILDDFGTSPSSFATLRDLPVDYLKIDGEFVQDMAEDRVKRAMVESINQIGHLMNIRTIAEWVENRATFDALRSLGVDYAQGYWLCRPQPLVHDP